MPRLVLPEGIARTDGSGPKIDLGADCGKLLVLTLGIDRIVEQENLIVSIRGSRDGLTWNPAPLATFPPKYYCGMYSILLNLAHCPDVKYIRAEWKMNRWGPGDHTPLFEFYVLAEASGSRVSTAAAGSRAGAGVV